MLVVLLLVHHETSLFILSMIFDAQPARPSFVVSGQLAHRRIKFSTFSGRADGRRVFEYATALINVNESGKPGTGCASVAPHRMMRRHQIERPQNSVAWSSRRALA
jgi:hypothetical protein